jgi:hypothetical protein
MVRWDKEGIVLTGGYTYLYWDRFGNHQLGTGILYQRIIPSVKTVEFVSNRMLYIVLRGRWCNVIVVNVHTPREEICDYSNNNFMRN